MVRTKRDVAELKTRAINSLVLAIELFNRPHDQCRTEAVLILLHHSFEMLLKAIIQQRVGSIYAPGAKFTHGFDKCLEITLSQLRVITADERAALSILDAHRDTAVHFYLEISEDLLYVQAQASVTLFDDLLFRVFKERLAEILSTRILPISSRPPKDLALLIDHELSQIDELLKAGSRKGSQAAARLRPILALATASREDAERVAETELRKAIVKRRRGEEWNVIFPEIAQLRLDTQGDGIPFYLRIKKDAPLAVRVAKDGEPVVGTLIKQEVNIWDKFNLGRNDLAEKLCLSGPKTSALIIELGLQSDPECFKILTRKRSTFNGYSKKALEQLQRALADGINVDEIWNKHKASLHRSRGKA